MAYDLTEKDKRDFAAAWARLPGEPLKAALSCGYEIGVASYIAQHWPTADDVKRYRQEYIDEAGGEMALLPSKVDYLRQLWAYATQQGFPATERYRFMELFGASMGYTPTKNGVTVNNEAPKPMHDITQNDVDEFIKRFN